MFSGKQKFLNKILWNTNIKSKNLNCRWLKKYTHDDRDMLTTVHIGGSKGNGGARETPPTVQKFFQFHAVFGGKIGQIIVGAPISGKSWIRHWFILKFPEISHTVTSKWPGKAIGFRCRGYNHLLPLCCGSLSRALCIENTFSECTQPSLSMSHGVRADSQQAKANTNATLGTIAFQGV